MMFRRILISVLSILLISVSMGWSAEPKKLLLLGQKPDGHPPGTHEYMPGMRLLAKCLSSIQGGLCPGEPGAAADVHGVQPLGGLPLQFLGGLPLQLLGGLLLQFQGDLCPGEPGACCFRTTCQDLCEPECLAAGGDYQGDGTSCADVPPPCGTPPAECVTGPFFGVAKEPGGPITFGGPGYPTLLPVTAARMGTRPS